MGVKLGRLWHRLKNNIKIDFKETEYENVDWIQLAQERVQWQALVNMVMNLWFPLVVGCDSTPWSSFVILLNIHYIKKCFTLKF
jgi:hypothetical protein